MSTELKEAEQFLQSFNAAWKNMGLYSASHPAATAAFQKLKESLERLLGGGERVTLGLIQDTLILNGMPLMAKSDLSRNLVTRLRDGEIQGVTFLKGSTVEDLRHFVEALGRDAKNMELEQDLKKRGISRILLVTLSQERPEKEESPTEVVDRVGAGAIYNRALQTIRKVFHETRFGKVPALNEIQRAVDDIVGGILKGKHSLMALTMIKSYDEYLFNHSVNVGILTTALGDSLRLDANDLRELGLGALLHDLGKIQIPETVTRKPRDLTQEEWELIKQHPEEGVRMLDQMGVRSEVALRVVREHHVRFNRTGYPTLGPQEDVHPYSMIVTIADSYDALTTLRPYQRLFEPSEAITLMKTLAGSTFDPQMLERFIDMLGIYPPGTVVRLTTGEIAVVTRPGSEDSSRPWVQIVQNAEGQVSEGLEFNLMEWNSEMEDYTRSILIALDPAIRGIDALGVLRGADATPGG